jgi:RNA polymerase sigma-70 factor (ECF subfamily)
VEALLESDESLVEKIVFHQNRAAAEELVSKYYKKIYREIYLKTSDEELSLDLTQETFISILKNLQQFDASKASFKTWSARIAKNKVIDYMRSRHHHESLVTELLDDHDKEDEGNLEEHVVNRMATQKVEHLLLNEHEENRDIFSLKAKEGYTFEEISQMTGIKKPVVKNRYYTIVKKMRKELQGYE